MPHVCRKIYSDVSRLLSTKRGAVDTHNNIVKELILYLYIEVEKVAQSFAFRMSLLPRSIPSLFATRIEVQVQKGIFLSLVSRAL